MSYQYQWVVTYDEDWGAFMLDAESTWELLVPNKKTIYNKETGRYEWREAGPILDELNRLEEILAYNLTRLDLSEKV